MDKQQKNKRVRVRLWAKVYWKLEQPNLNKL